MLLYDRAFLGGSFREAWRRRHRAYLGLASTWILLVCLVIGGGGGRGASSGFGIDIPWWAYGLTQFQAIAQYLKLAVWPHPLVFEYGTFWVRNAWQVIPCACLVVPLIAASIAALWRWPAWGFLGFCFFAILAPTSLVPGTMQMIVEHRMYLALAPVVVAIACAGRAATGASGAWPVMLLVFSGVCGVLTAHRNDIYRSDLALWQDTVAKRPEGAVARCNLAIAWTKVPGKLDEAIAQFKEALRLRPEDPELHCGLGNALLDEGRTPEAILQYQEALRLRPDLVKAHLNLGNALLKMRGRLDDAIAQYEEAARLEPGVATAHYNLGNALRQAGRTQEAIAQYGEALRLEPDVALAHYDLGIALLDEGRTQEAIAQHQEALRLKPDFAEAHNNLGNALSRMPGKLDDAIAQFGEALRLRPEFTEAHYNLGNALLNKGRTQDAIAQFEETLRLKPDSVEAHLNLGIAWTRMPGRSEDAIAQFEAALRLDPDNAGAHNNLGSACAPKAASRRRSPV